jgi:predicted transcriptional regulator
MAISNELSSEIAAAILQENKSPHELEQLKEVVLQVHTALQEMSREARTKRFEAAGVFVKPRESSVRPNSRFPNS